MILQIVYSLDLVLLSHSAGVHDKQIGNGCVDGCAAATFDNFSIRFIFFLFFTILSIFKISVRVHYYTWMVERQSREFDYVVTVKKYVFLGNIVFSV